MLEFKVEWIHAPDGKTGLSPHTAINRCRMLEMINMWNWSTNWKYWLGADEVGVPSNETKEQ